ncbi:hypothetical protein ACYIMG_10130, partial [Enterococcus faecium]
NVVHSDSDLILHNSSVLIDKEPIYQGHCLFSSLKLLKDPAVLDHWARLKDFLCVFQLCNIHCLQKILID